MIPLYADENVDERIVQGLRRRGIDVLTAQEAGLTGEVDDAEHLALATRLGRVLVSSDADLLAIANDWAAASRPHAGLVYYHQLWTTLGAVVRDVAVRATTLSPDDARNLIIHVPRNQKSKR